MHLKKQPSTQDELLTSGVQVDKIGDVVKQEKKSEIMGKENLDENVDDPPPAVPSKPAKAAKKLPPSPGSHFSFSVYFRWKILSELVQIEISI